MGYCLVTYLMNMIMLNILIAVTGDVYDEYKEKAKIMLMKAKIF